MTQQRDTGAVMRRNNDELGPYWREWCDTGAETVRLLNWNKLWSNKQNQPREVQYLNFLSDPLKLLNTRENSSSVYLICVDVKLLCKLYQEVRISRNEDFNKIHKRRIEAGGCHIFSVSANCPSHHEAVSSPRLRGSCLCQKSQDWSDRIWFLL